MRRLYLLALLLPLWLAGCGAGPAPVRNAPDRSEHHPALTIADRLIGTPYRYGGTSPRQGFDCSGLVWYAFSQAGYAIPRTTSGQFASSRRVSLGELMPGDVVFFRIAGKPSHVGLYAGDGRFIHAPSSGKRVRYDLLARPYWQARIVKAGRFR